MRGDRPQAREGLNLPLLRRDQRDPVGYPRQQPDPTNSCDGDRGCGRPPDQAYGAIAGDRRHYMAGGQTDVEGLTGRQLGEHLHSFAEVWTELFPAEQARIVQLLVTRVEVSPAGAEAAQQCAREAGHAVWLLRSSANAALPARVASDIVSKKSDCCTAFAFPAA
jgi:hypothetical protein